MNNELSARNVAAATLLIPFTVVDMVLSVASLRGILGATNAVSLMFAIVGGIGITLLAVGSSYVWSAESPDWLVPVWLAATAVDIVTSFIGIVWYGVLSKDLDADIKYSKVFAFRLENSVPTVLYLMLTVLFYGGCHYLGGVIHENAKLRKQR